MPATHDFSCCDISLGINNSQSCVIFDDHQHALPRLEQAINHGFKYIIFDDNYYEYTYHTTLMNLMRDKHPVVEYLSELIEDYYLFPPITYPKPENCPLEPLYRTPPDELSEFDLEKELIYSWVTYIKIKE